jgi:hypothetical protein
MKSHERSGVDGRVSPERNFEVGRPGWPSQPALSAGPLSRPSQPCQMRRDCMNEIEIQQWAEALRSARASETEDSCDRFVELIQAAAGGGLAEAKALLSTITDQPEDVGQGEAVLSFLCRFPLDIQLKAIVAEIPRLEGEGQHEWAESLVENEARFHPDDLITVTNGESAETRMALRVVLGRISMRARSRGAVDMAVPVLNALQD